MDVWDDVDSRELLRYFQEKCDAIEKVTIPKPPYILLPQTGEEVEASMVLHLLSGEMKVIPDQKTAEAVLNDGLLHRLKIRIELEA